MKLSLVRKIFTAESTIGELAVDGTFECVTLEDPVRDRKVPDVTAIPGGAYDLVITQSPKFGRLMPRLENVKGFEGILIHWGNTAVDTRGCILVGRTSSKNFIGSSKVTFNALFANLQEASGRGERLAIAIT